MDNKNKKNQSSYWLGVNAGAICFLSFLFAWSGVKEGDYWKAGALGCVGVGLVIVFQPKETNED